MTLADLWHDSLTTDEYKAKTKAHFEQLVHHFAFEDIMELLFRTFCVVVFIAACYSHIGMLSLLS